MNKKMKIITAVAAPLLLFTGCVGGVGIGSSSDGDTAASEPAPTETVTAEPEPAPTVTETPEPVVEEVEVASQSCLDALDAGDETIDLLTQAIFAASDALGGASRMDPGAITSATAEIDELTPQVEDSAFDWGLNSAACRDGA